MYCSECGKENEDVTKFCANCGARLRGDTRNQSTPKKGVEPMLKLLGQMIMGGGLIVLLFSGFGYLTNQPVKLDPAKSRIDPIFGRMDLLNVLETNTENMRRKHKREEAQKLAVLGVVITIIGGGVIAISKRAPE